MSKQPAPPPHPNNVAVSDANLSPPSNSNSASTSIVNPYYNATKKNMSHAFNSIPSNKPKIVHVNPYLKKTKTQITNQKMQRKEVQKQVCSASNQLQNQPYTLNQNQNNYIQSPSTQLFTNDNLPAPKSVTKNTQQNQLPSINSSAQATKSFTSHINPYRTKSMPRQTQRQTQTNPSSETKLIKTENTVACYSNTSPVNKTKIIHNPYDSTNQNRKRIKKIINSNADVTHTCAININEQLRKESMPLPSASPHSNKLVQEKSNRHSSSKSIHAPTYGALKISSNNEKDEFDNGIDWDAAFSAMESHHLNVPTSKKDITSFQPMAEQTILAKEVCFDTVPTNDQLFQPPIVKTSLTSSTTTYQNPYDETKNESTKVNHNKVNGTTYRSKTPHSFKKSAKGEDPFDNDIDWNTVDISTSNQTITSYTKSLHLQYTPKGLSITPCQSPVEKSDIEDTVIQHKTTEVLSASKSRKMQGENYKNGKNNDYTTRSISRTTSLQLEQFPNRTPPSMEIKPYNVQKSQNGAYFPISDTSKAKESACDEENISTDNYVKKSEVQLVQQSKATPRQSSNPVDIVSADNDDNFDNGIDWTVVDLSAVDRIRSKITYSNDLSNSNEVRTDLKKGGSCERLIIGENALSNDKPRSIHLENHQWNLNHKGTEDPKLKADSETSSKAVDKKGTYTKKPVESTTLSMSRYNSTCSTSSTSYIASKQSSLPPLPAEIDYDKKRLLPVEDGYRSILIQNANISKPLLNGWELHPHQKVAILKGLKLRRLLLAYDMGLGKTLIACVWAKAFKLSFACLKAYIIAPVSLREEWKKTAFETTGMETAPEKLPKKNVDKENLDICITTWGKVPKEVPSYVHKFVVICDEAHQMQSMNAARTKDVLNLTAESRCIGCLLLTGTPMKNGKPSNLFPLLRAIRHPFGDRQKIYEILFCAGKEKQYGPNKRVWDANGSSNLPILNAHISSHVLHVTKEDCLKNLPPKKRVTHKVAVSRYFEMMYTNKINDLAKAQQLYEGLESRDMSEALLGLLQKVRFSSSIAKVDAAVALAMTILEKEPAIVIFTSFVEVAKNVHMKLNDSGWAGEILTGETPSAKRAQAVNKFQGGLSPVFVCTFGAGGVGLTLTAASTTILLDRPWTPGEALQAEDRVRRIGQKKAVTSIWMTAFEVDEQIDDMIEQKKMTSNRVIDGRENLDLDKDYSGGCCFDGKIAPKLSIMQLVRRIVPNGPDSSFTGLKHPISNMPLSTSKGGGFNPDPSFTGLRRSYSYAPVDHNEGGGFSPDPSFPGLRRSYSNVPVDRNEGGGFSPDPSFTVIRRSYSDLPPVENDEGGRFTTFEKEALD